MERVFSGIQPTGTLHIGNYLGAIRNWAAIQNDFDCLFGVVDLHAMTAPYDAKVMPSRVTDLAAGLLACGIDPDRATLFVQSDVPEHTELAWVFNCVTPMGELSRQTQFKSKSDHQQDNINVGLFTYPVLQAADILLYKATRVPVGEDQEQHLELSREIARKFNARFGQTFAEARTMFTSTPRIRGLDGQAKMSKSLDNHIAVDEDEKTVRGKLASAFTDPDRKRRSDPGNPDICNVYTLHGFFSSPETVAQVQSDCRGAQIGCVDCKKMLGTAIIEHFKPIRERLQQLRARPHEVEQVLQAGRERCRALAAETMREVRDKVGLTRDASS